MSFTLSGDHERQEQVFERLNASCDKQPYVIRRMLTEGAVRASDKRAQFIGVDAFVAAGGTVLHDLFQGDDGGWLQDVMLVDQMVADKLKSESEVIAAEGWKWIEVASDFPYGHTFGLRQLRGDPVPLTAEEEATREAFQEEFDRLSREYEAADELPDDVDQRLGELETALEGFEARPLTFNPAEMACAGAFISIAPDGRLRVERGYVRREDELPVEPTTESGTAEEACAVAAPYQDGEAIAVESEASAIEPEEDEGLTPISDRLMTELTAHRTLGLRRALGEQPQVAFHAALHALTLKVFYHYGSDSCLELDLKSVSFGPQAPGLNDSASAESIRARHQNWAKALPKESTDLWDVLQEWDGDSQAMLFAHVVSLSVNAVHEAWNRRPRALAHADRLAEAVELNMATAGWRPTVDNFFGRVTKARILQAVTEAKGQPTADRIEHLKKGDMATEADALLADTAWLPEPLRTPKRSASPAPSASVNDEIEADDRVSAEAAANNGESAMVEPVRQAHDEPVAAEPHAAAAE
jgi:ParB family chromosome partitioning protein